MEVNNPLEIQDADNIDFNTEVLNESSDESSDEAPDGNESNNETHNEREPSTTDENENEDEEDKTNHVVEPNEMALDEPGFFYNLLHILDDIYVYGRTVIENN